MKMKTTKFLAVLAVLAMAFAAVAVIAPAADSDAGTITAGIYKNADGTEALTTADYTVTTNTTWYVAGNYSTATAITVNSGTLTLAPCTGEEPVLTIAVASSIKEAGAIVIGTDVKVTIAAAVTNDGTITNNSHFQAITVNGGEIKSSTSSVKGTINGTAAEGLVFLLSGTVSYQNIDSTKMTVDTDGVTDPAVRNNHSGAASSGTMTVDHCIFTVPDDVSRAIYLKSADAAHTITITNNTFNSAGTTAQKVVAVELGFAATAGTKYVELKGNTFNIGGYFEKGAEIYLDGDAVAKTIGTATTDNVVIDSKVKRIWFGTSGYTINSNLTLDTILVKNAKSFTVADAKTLTSDVFFNPDYNNDDTAYTAKATGSFDLGNGAIFSGAVMNPCSDPTDPTLGMTNKTAASANIYLKGSVDTNSNKVTISAGSVIVTGPIAALEGSYIEQTLGTVKLGDVTAFAVPNTATIDIGGKVTGEIANEGTVNLDTGVDVTGGLNITGAGKVVDNTDDDDMEELVIGGNSMGDSTTFSSEQKVIVSSELGYWTLNSGSKVTILGALVIPAGTVMTVQAGAELVIDNLAKVYVEGTLVIDTVDGTLSAGKLTFSRGFISVEGLVSLNGTLAMGYTNSYVTELDVENGGSFIVGETGSFTVAEGSEFFVAEGGELTVYGLMGSTIWNSGTVTIDSDVEATSSTAIYMWTAGATVDVVNYTIRADKLDTTLTISDKGMIFTTYREQSEDKTVYLGDTKDEVVISMAMTDGSADYSITFSGLKVVSGSSSTTKTKTDGDSEETGYYNGKQYSKYLDVSGMFYVDYTYIGTTTGADKVVGATVSTSTSTDTTLGKYCAVKVTDEIVINDYVTLNNAAGVLTVTGSIDTMSKDAKVTNAATITVDGAGNISCVINTIISETGINAAKFMTVATDISGKTYKIYNYYSIDGALAVVAAEPVTSEIIILGKQTMKVSATLPAGISLVLINSSASLTINKDVTFEIEAGAPLKGEGTVNVNGSMYANEKTDVKNSVTVISDVKTEEMDAQGKPTKTGWALWTNLTDALAAAEAGDVITITKKTTNGFVTVSKNLIIPDGVALVAPKDFDPLLLKNGVTLTIDGILVVGSNIYAEQAFGLDAQNTSGTNYKARYSSAIVVNGALISTVAITYGDGAADTVAPTTANANKVALIGDQYAQGRHITFTSADGTQEIPATPVTAPIAGAYYDIKGGNVTYKAISSLEFAADNLDAITSDIVIRGSVGGLMLSFAKTDYFDMITVNDDDDITAPTSMATDSAVATELTVATLVLNEVSLESTANGTFTGIVGNGTDALTCVDVKNMTVLDKDDKLYVHGAVTADTTGAGLAITAGAVYLGTSGTGGTQFAYTGTNTATIKNYLIVADDAEAIVENCGTINLLWIEGYFGVPAAKSANVTNLVDLGEVEVAAVTETTAKGTLNITNMFVGADAMPKEAEETAIATISGPITLTNTAYTMGDAIIGLDTAAYLATLHYTTFMVDDEEYYTVFDAKNNASVLVDNTPKILDAVITGWYSEDDKKVDFASTTVGTYPVVYAYLNYNIYSVYIVTDAGVKSVAINGIEMVSQGNNVFTLGVKEKDILTPLIAGTYKVTFTLKSGYQEDKNGVTLYTEDGTILKDLKFDAAGASILTTIKLQLNGTEIIPEPEPVTPEEQSEWTITTILLCVLVVLIAIMAVIVALRLNRN